MSQRDILVEAHGTMSERAVVISGERVLDESAFFEATRRAAAGFQSLGIANGDSIALLLRNELTFLVAQLGAMRAGGQPVSLNWHSGTDDLRYILEDSGAKVLVVHADLGSRVRDVLPAGCRMVVVPTPPELKAAFGLTAEEVQVRPEDLNWENWLQSFEPLNVTGFGGGGLGIYYTSGTTGRPKGIMREPLNDTQIEQTYSVLDEIFGVKRGDPVRVLVSAPLYHGGPNLFAVRGTMSGSTTIIQPRFSAREMLRLIEHHRVTHLYLVPMLMMKLLDIPADERANFDLSSLRRVAHSAAPCPIAVKQQMIDWLGPIIFEFYGGTENGSITLISSEESLRKPGSVGRAMRNCRIKIVRSDGAEAAVGEIGEIFARNFNMPGPVYRNPADGIGAVHDGLISIGDVGLLDDDGYLFIRDRKRDMVISAGVNIFPVEIENVLLSLDGVADCAVFGIPDPLYGEAVCAHIEPMPGYEVRSEDVIDWLKLRLASYQVPRLVKIDTALPREASGKIMKRRIRDGYWADAGRSV